MFTLLAKTLGVAKEGLDGAKPPKYPGTLKKNIGIIK